MQNPSDYGDMNFFHISPEALLSHTALGNLFIFTPQQEGTQIKRQHLRQRQINQSPLRNIPIFFSAHLCVLLFVFVFQAPSLGGLRRRNAYTTTTTPRGRRAGGTAAASRRAPGRRTSASTASPPGGTSRARWRLSSRAAGWTTSTVMTG